MKDVLIKQVQVKREQKGSQICLMDQEIRNTRVCYHKLKEEEICWKPCENAARILFVCSGTVEFRSGSKCVSFLGRGVFIGKAEAETTAAVNGEAELLEIIRYLTKEEYDCLKGSTDFPYVLHYENAQRYLEEGKSEKTISRMLVPQRLIPRFAMGSVETYGKDLIEPHSHPLLEQFFFSFAENECALLIDDLVWPYSGNTLLHIPLGSMHGVSSEKEQTVHYLWMDFLFDEKGLQYMDEVHHMI